MIDKLYKLKQQQINQQLLLKQQVLAKINDIDEELKSTNHNLHTVSVDVMGAISDFRVLQIHKETMKEHIVKLTQKKIDLKKQADYYDSLIVVFNKESEQFNYILKEQLKEKAKIISKQEDEVAAEYMQAKYIQNKGKSVW